MYTFGPFLEGLLGDHYWIGVVDYYRRYSWSFFTDTKSQLPKKMAEFLDKMTSCGTLSKNL